MTINRILSAAILLISSVPIAQAIDIVILNKPHSELDRRAEYSTRLLKRALERTTPQYGPYEIRYTRYVMERGRTTASDVAASALAPSSAQTENDRLLSEMKLGELVNVTPQPTRPEWEQALLTVRIPVDKGLFSFRISLIKAKDQAEFSRITSLEALKKQPMGISKTWTVYRIFKAANFNLVDGTTYEGLFEMLNAGRFKHLTRALYEAPLEVEDRKDKLADIVMEKDLMIFFPQPRYFFVSPKFPQLAKRIEAGLSMMIKDGSFDRLLFEYHLPLLEQTGFCQRRIFRMDNPFLSKETPLNRKELWLYPDTGKKEGRPAICSHLPAKYAPRTAQ